LKNKTLIKKKIKVLIVDDSISIRKFITSLLSFDQSIEVVGAIDDSFVALEMLEKLKPDVVTLDLHMPKMDGLTFLEKMMKIYPIPTIIISSFAKENSENALKAFSLGAIDIFPKQVISPGLNIEPIAHSLITKVRVAARAILNNKVEIKPVVKQIAIEPLPEITKNQKIKIISIAASTGGTEALRNLLSKLPSNIPGILIVQHMPKEFLLSFAESLGRVCQFELKLAENNDEVLPGRALLAPGDIHMEIIRIQNSYFIRLKEGPLIHGVRPSANPLFSSMARNVGKHGMGIILTGMGGDGAEGLFEMKKAGSFNIAQDEKSCVVFGMPKKAIAKGAIDEVLPLDKIPDRIIIECSKLELKNVI
jgi:two-component system chemotaxis response regulator CheB